MELAHRFDPVTSMDMTVPVVVINGPVGVGKSSVLGEVSDLLAEAGIAHCSLDLDALSQTFPSPEDDPFNLLLATNNLRAVWANAAAAGAERLVLASVVESEAHLQMMMSAVPDAEPFVCRLCAPVAVLHQRLRRREIGSALDWHLYRAGELAEILEDSGVGDVVIDTSDRPLRDIATEILEAADWLPR